MKKLSHTALDVVYDIKLDKSKDAETSGKIKGKFPWKIKDDKLTVKA